MVALHWDRDGAATSCWLYLYMLKLILDFIERDLERYALCVVHSQK